MTSTISYFEPGLLRRAILLTFFFFRRESCHVGSLASIFLVCCRLPFLLRCTCRLNNGRIPRTPCNRIDTNHLHLPSLDKVRQLSKSDIQRLLLTIHLHGFVGSCTLIPLIDALVYGQRKFRPIRRCRLKLGRMESEKNRGLVVVLENLTMDREVRSVGARWRCGRPPPNEVEGRDLVYILYYFPVLVPDPRPPSRPRRLW